LLFALLVKLLVVPGDSFFAFVKDVYFEVGIELLARFVQKTVADSHAGADQRTIFNHLGNNDSLNFKPGLGQITGSCEGLLVLKSIFIG